MITKGMREAVESAKKKGLLKGPGIISPVTTAGPEAAKFAGVTVSFETITPDIARGWLNNNKGNRALRETTVKAYVRDMRAGEWVTNHQGIAFSADHVLLDGQHRLHAIVASGVPVLLMVSRGWPTQPEGKRVRTMDTVDVGAGRSLSDLLQLQHATENPRIVTASSRCVAQICSGLTGGSFAKMTMSSLLLVTAQYPEGLRFVALNAPKHKGLRRAEVLAVMAMAYARWPEETQKFCQMLVTGAGLDEGHPILPLRNFLLTDVDKAKFKDLQIATYAATHLRAWITGKKCERLTRSEDALEWIRTVKPEASAKIAALFKGEAKA